MVQGKGNIPENIDKVLTGSRSFEIIDDATGNIHKYYVVMPTAEEARRGQWEYTKAYNKALVEKVLTANEMSDILKSRNIIGDAYDDRLGQLHKNIQEKMVEMELADDREEKRSKAVEISELREELVQWNSRFAGPMHNTAEQLAADARIDYFTSVLVRDDKANRVWGSDDEYLKENDQMLSIKSRLEVMLWLEGLDSDVLENTPEQVVLRELEEADRVDAAANKEPVEVVSEELVEPIVVDEGSSEKVEKAKSKTTRKRRSTTRKTKS